MDKMLSNKTTILMLVLPGILVFALVIPVPLLLSVFYGMTNYNIVTAPHFVGLSNFINILKDQVFWISLLHCFIIAAGLVFIQHPLALAFALVLNKVGGRAEKYFRAAYFIPAIIPVTVITAMWKNVFNPQFGFLNKLLEALGLGNLKMDFMGNPHTALLSIVFISIWYGFGWAVLIYYAGVKGLPEELFEAAKIDGAGRIRRLFSMTIPLLRPVLIVNLSLAIIAGLKSMTIVYLTTGGSVGNASQVVANYFYKVAFTSQQYGYGNALSVLFVIICMIVTVSFNKVTDGSRIEF